MRGQRPLVKGIDYELDELGRFVLTRRYHLRRGYCCGSGCRNCPYDPAVKGNRVLKKAVDTCEKN